MNIPLESRVVTEISSRNNVQSFQSVFNIQFFHLLFVSQSRVSSLGRSIQYIASDGKLYCTLAYSIEQGQSTGAVQCSSGAETDRLKDPCQCLSTCFQHALFKPKIVTIMYLVLSSSTWSCPNLSLNDITAIHVYYLLTDTIRKPRSVCRVHKDKQ